MAFPVPTMTNVPMVPTTALPMLNATITLVDFLALVMPVSSVTDEIASMLTNVLRVPTAATITPSASTLAVVSLVPAIPDSLVTDIAAVTLMNATKCWTTVIVTHDASTTRVVSLANVILVSWATVSLVKISMNVTLAATLVTFTPSVKTRLAHSPADVALDSTTSLVSPVTDTAVRMLTNAKREQTTVMPMLNVLITLVDSTANVSEVSLVMALHAMMLMNVPLVLTLAHLTQTAKTTSVAFPAAAWTAFSRKMELVSTSMSVRATRTTVMTTPFAVTTAVDSNVLVKMVTLVTVFPALM
jgi:hypothetical protein